MTTRFSVAVKEKQKQPVWMPWVQRSGSASLVQLGWGRALFPSQRHCNQIYGCSSALPQHDAVVWSSACSSWKQAEGEQLTRAGRACSLQGAFFPPKAKRYVWDSCSCSRGGFSGASSWCWAGERRRIRWGWQLLVGKQPPTGGLRGAGSSAQTPFGETLYCAYGTSAVLLHMPEPSTRRNLPACGME